MRNPGFERARAAPPARRVAGRAMPVRFLARNTLTALSGFGWGQQVQTERMDFVADGTAQHLKYHPLARDP